MHIPKGICANCGVELKCMKNGKMIEMMLEDGTPYYKISSDMYGCEGCGAMVCIGFAPQAIESFDEGYENIKADMRANFR